MPPQSIMLQPIFPSALPPRLYGLIRAAEFEASIARCNAAFAHTWQHRAVQLAGIGGMIVLVVMTVLALPGSASVGMLIAGFSCGGGVLLFASVLGNYLERKQQERMRVTVAAESEYYNSKQRAARFGPLRVPISWTIASGPKLNGERDKRGQPIMVTGIQIEIGGGMLVAASQPQPQSQPPPLTAGPPFAQPAAYGAPQPFAGHYAQPAYPQPPNAQPSYAQATFASTYAQPAQAPFAQERQAPPAYSSHAQQLQSGQSPAAADSWAAEGQPFKGHAVASPPLAQQSLPHSTGAGSCERCGRVAPNAADRFCAACGGSIV